MISVSIIGLSSLGSSPGRVVILATGKKRYSHSVSLHSDL